MFTVPREKQTDRDEVELCWHKAAPRAYLLSSCYVFNSFIPSINDIALLQHLATGGDTTLPHAAQPLPFHAHGLSLGNTARSLHTGVRLGFYFDSNVSRFHVYYLSFISSRQPRCISPSAPSATGLDEAVFHLVQTFLFSTPFYSIRTTIYQKLRA